MPPVMRFGTTVRVGDAPRVHRGNLRDLVARVGKRRLDQERRRNHAVVTQGLVVAAELIELAERVGVVDGQRRSALRTELALRRIAEERRVERWLLAICQVAFAE